MRAINRSLAVVCAAGIPLALSATAHGQLILDGNFNALGVGNTPDCATASGAWQWPAAYTTALLCEVNATDYTVVATNSFQPAAPGNSLALNVTDAVNSIHLANILPAALPQVAGQTIKVEWQVWVQATGGGATVYIGADMGGGGYSNATDRGPQISWLSDGSIQYNANGINTIIVPSYPRGQWQSVRVDVHLDTQKYDFYWAASGTPVLIQSGLAYRVPTTALINKVDRFSVVHFGATAGLGVSTCFYDNVVISLSPPSCYADCDHVGGLTGNDFQCFLNAYVANSSYADCDGVGGLTGNDFQCFLNKYVAGCS